MDCIVYKFNSDLIKRKKEEWNNIYKISDANILLFLS